MKHILWIACVAMVIALGNNAVSATPAADDLIKLARSGVDEEVLTAYIDTAPDTFGLSADDIITLKDLGVSSKVISDALRHGYANASDSAAAIEAREAIRAASQDTLAAAAQPYPEVVTTAAVAPPPADQNISFFYQTLYPYGNWLYIDGAWYWQPSAAVMDPDWTPYCTHGHWEYSDWGWFWVSDYSWGWAPFHYGRWFHHHRHGWCWMPDTEWGPAWVVWRMGDDYCGWAPLPPHARFDDRGWFWFGNVRVGEDFEFNLTFGDYCFVPNRYFYNRHPWVHLVPSVLAKDAYRKTDFIRKPYSIEHGHIVNRGLLVDKMSKVSNRQIPTITIVHDDLKPGQPIHRSFVKGNQLLIYKPVIAPAVPKDPNAIKLLFEMKAASAQPQKNDQTLVTRQKTVAQQTLKDQQLKAKNAAQEQISLERAAASEYNSNKRTELQAEAQIQSVRNQQARNHVVHIKQWNPQAAQKREFMPRSRVVPQPPEETRGQVQTRVRSQIRNEAQIEQQRQPAVEQMIRSHAGQQINGGHHQEKNK